MDIKINDRFRITTDPYNFVVEEFRTVFPKKKEVPPSEKWVHIGYYPTIETAFQCMMQHTAKQSEAIEIKSILSELVALRDDMVKAAKTIKVVKK